MRLGVDKETGDQVVYVDDLLSHTPLQVRFGANDMVAVAFLNGKLLPRGAAQNIVSELETCALFLRNDELLIEIDGASNKEELQKTEEGSLSIVWRDVSDETTELIMEIVGDISERYNR